MINPLINKDTLKPPRNGPEYSNTVIGTLAVDGWAVPNVTAHPTANMYTNFIFLNGAPKLPLHYKGLTLSLESLGEI